MDPLAKHIRESTGLTMQEFCSNYLESELQAFRSRVKKGKLYPNEAFLICLHTGKSPVELFGRQAMEIFFLNGKESVTARVKELLKNNPAEKVNMILNDPSGLKIAVPDLTQLGKKQERKSREKKPKAERPPLEAKKPEPVKESVNEGNLDFVATNLFR